MGYSFLSTTCAWLSTLLDQEQIERTGTIASHMQPVESMPDRSGTDIAAELGNRFLLRYLVASQLKAFNDGSTSRGHWVTPTAISPADIPRWLAPYAPDLPREHVLLLDAAKISFIRGPAWIRLGQGVEYYLPNGFPKEAIVDVGVVEVS